MNKVIVLFLVLVIGLDMLIHHETTKVKEFNLRLIQENQMLHEQYQTFLKTIMEALVIKEEHEKCRLDDE